MERRALDMVATSNCEPVNIKDMPLARVYMPFQHMKEIYTGKEGFLKGTIFPELYKPYTS
jgi:hypothetical protein